MALEDPKLVESYVKNTEDALRAEKLTWRVYGVGFRGDFDSLTPEVLALGVVTEEVERLRAELKQYLHNFQQVFFICGAAKDTDELEAKAREVFRHLEARLQGRSRALAHILSTVEGGEGFAIDIPEVKLPWDKVNELKEAARRQTEASRAKGPGATGAPESPRGESGSPA